MVSTCTLTDAHQDTLPQGATLPKKPSLLRLNHIDARLAITASRTLARMHANAGLAILVPAAVAMQQVHVLPRQVVCRAARPAHHKLTVMVHRAGLYRGRTRCLPSRSTGRNVSLQLHGLRIGDH